MRVELWKEAGLSCGLNVGVPVHTLRITSSNPDNSMIEHLTKKSLHPLRECVGGWRSDMGVCGRVQVKEQ